MAAELSSGYELHVAVWNRDSAELQALLERREHDLEQKDPQGNTALLLAYRLGLVEEARMLLAAGADSKARDGDGWESVYVAALSGNIELLRIAVVEMLRETDRAWERRIPGMLHSLKAMPNFDMEMEWEFTSWLPLVSKFLPKDTVRIRKSGSSLRMDSTLLGMEGMSWARGRMSFIVAGEESPHPGHLYVVDHDDQRYSSARLAFTHPKDIHQQDWVRKLMTRPQKVSDVWSRDTECEAVNKTALWGLVSTSEHLVEHVGDWTNSAVYTLRNFCIRTTTHSKIVPELKTEDWWRPEFSVEVADSRAAAEAADDETDETPENALLPLRNALAAIRAGEQYANASGLAYSEHRVGSDAGTADGKTVRTVSLEEYFGEDLAAKIRQQTPDVCSHNAVAQVLPENTQYEEKNLDLKVHFNVGFPLDIEHMLPVAEVMSRTSQHYNNFKDFFERRMPSGVGFPVQFSIPVFPTILATIRFTKCQIEDSIDSAVFQMPPEYELHSYIDKGLVRQI